MQRTRKDLFLKRLISYSLENENSRSLPSTSECLSLKGRYTNTQNAQVKNCAKLSHLNPTLQFEIEEIQTRNCGTQIVPIPIAENPKDIAMTLFLSKYSVKIVQKEMRWKEVANPMKKEYVNSKIHTF